MVSADKSWLLPLQVPPLLSKPYIGSLTLACTGAEPLPVNGNIYARGQNKYGMIQGR